MKKLLLLCLVVFLVVPAFADTLVYTNSSTWTSAAGALTSVPAGGGWPAGLAVNSGSGVGTFTTGSGVFSGLGVWYDQVTGAGYGSYITTFTFSSAITSFGALWDLAGPGGPGMGINVYIDGNFVGLIDQNTAGTFWGFVSTVPFTVITLTTDGQAEAWAETWQMTSIQYGVPEPGSLLLLGTGLIGLARIVRRRA